MILDNKLHIFPTTRSLNKTLINQKTLTNFITIKEFFEKATYKPNSIKVDDNIRFLLLKESIKTLEIELLGFSKNFVEFIEHSPFIFRFFDEVISEGASFDTIRSYDIYAGFDEHIDILEALHKNYQKLLTTEGFYDPIHSKDLVLNREYFEHFSSIELRASGYLTKLELNIIKNISSFTPIMLYIEIDSYNKNMIEKLKELDIEAEEGSLSIDIEQKSVHKHKRTENTATVFTYELKERLSQSTLCFSLLKDIIHRCEPENTAIIALDEGYIEFLKECDYYNNLNFAMGFPILKTQLFKELKAKIEKPQEGTPFFELSRKKGVKPLIEAINMEFRDSENYKHIKEQIFRFEKLSALLKNKNSKEIAILFLEKIKKQKIDDTTGGRIKVMGLLEARDIELDEIIILDFNKGIFPKSSFKDLFLNSFIKQKSNIPTPKQRENLQMHHLLETLKHVKKAHILYTQNDNLTPSKFLNFLKTKKVEIDEEAINSCFFGKSSIASEAPDPTLEIDLKTFTFSHSMLSTFLICKRKFYYRYIEKIKEPKREDNTSLLIGNLFHEFMESQGVAVYKSGDELHQELKAFFSKRELTNKERFDIELFLLQAWEFCELEYIRRKDGFIPLAHEVSFRAKLGGFDFGGRIDRIDIKDNKEYIIDYKTGKNIKVDTPASLKTTTNFQLLLYSLGRIELGKEVEGTYLYDIRGGKLKEERLYEQKLELLSLKLQDLEPKKQRFTKTETKSSCRFCEFKKLCRRE
ncbi:MAG: RecB family exonuclease [Campylobacterales bacterium]